MTHRNVLEQFKIYFPQYSERVVEWFPNGKNSIRIRHPNRRDFIFTYNGPNNWRFETVDSFIKALKGD